MSRLEDAARLIVRQCLAIQKSESVLVITDDPLHEIGYMLYKAACKSKARTMMLEIQPMLHSGQEPHISVAEIMQQVNVLILATSQSLSHTQARRMACRNGARCISLPGINHASFERITMFDFAQLADASVKLADILTIGRTVRVTAANGTDLAMSIENRKGYPEIGIVTKPGEFSNLPAGEASLAPLEGTADGTLVVDSGFGIPGHHEDPINIRIKEGRAVRISGTKCAAKLKQQLKKYGPEARWIAEFGIGTNQNAQICGLTLEDEKVFGTCHIALGNNVSFGGTIDVPLHLDGIVYQPTVVIDGKKIVDNGILII